jgi:hypothetical protein
MMGLERQREGRTRRRESESASAAAATRRRDARTNLPLLRLLTLRGREMRLPGTRSALCLVCIAAAAGLLLLSG